MTFRTSTSSSPPVLEQFKETKPEEAGAVWCHQASSAKANQVVRRDNDTPAKLIKQARTLMKTRGVTERKFPFRTDVILDVFKEQDKDGQSHPVETDDIT